MVKTRRWDSRVNDPSAPFGGNAKFIFVGLTAVAAIALTVIAFNVTRPATTTAAANPIPTFGTVAPTRTTFAAVGDSVTEGDSPSFSEMRTGSLSWVTYIKDPGLRFVGGFAKGGSSTAAMVRNVTRYAADDLVILAGTNDTGLVPFAESTSNLDKIVTQAGVRRVYVVSIPPRNADPQLSVDYNAKLKMLAQQRGWTYVDAYSAIVTAGSYSPGLTIDGIHPTVDGAKKIADTIQAAMLAKL